MKTFEGQGPFGRIKIKHCLLLMTTDSDTPLLPALAESTMFRNCQEAFGKATGLPMRAHTFLLQP